MKRYSVIEYDLPHGWVAEEEDDVLEIYAEDGDGAITLSVYSFLLPLKEFHKAVYSMAEKMCLDNGVDPQGRLQWECKKDREAAVSGGGITSDSWLMKLWCVAKYPKIVMATYFSKTESQEMEICDQIIKSIRFSL